MSTLKRFAKAADAYEKAGQLGVDLDEHETLCAHPVIQAKLRRIIEEKNKALASYETIKKFVIVDKDFEIGEELTPTLKVRRKVVTEKYWDQLDGLYA